MHRILLSCLLFALSCGTTIAADQAQHHLHHDGRSRGARDQRLRVARQQDAAPRSHRQGGRALRKRLRHQLDLHAEPRRDPHRPVLAHQRRDGLQPVRQQPHDGRAVAAAAWLLHRHGWQVASRERPVRASIAGKSFPGQGAYFDPVLYTATGEKTYTGRYATDVITDLAVDFIDKRPRDKPFFLMMHHKAPHRPWQPDPKYAAQFAGRWIPEPVTMWDSYATRTDALHENAQRISKDLTRRDLKLQPPSDLSGAELTAWLGTKPDTVTIARDGKELTLTGDELRALEVSALHAGLPGHRAVGGRQRRPRARRARPPEAGEEHDRHLHERPGVLPRRSRPVRQALHVRGIAAHAVPRALAGGDQAGDASQRDGAERRFRADVSRGRGRAACPQRCRDAACCRC